MSSSVYEASTGDDRVVADLVADLQEARAGLRPWPNDRFRARVGVLRGDLDRCGMAGFVAELIEGTSAPDISAAAINLNGDEPLRLATYWRWREAANRHLPALWTWLGAAGARGEGAPTWWCRDIKLALHEETIELLRDATAPLRPIGRIARAWGRAIHLADPTAEHNWRWLALGRALDVSVPPFPKLMDGLVAMFRERGLVPPEHRVQVIRRPRMPSLVVPVRVPGRSILSVPVPAPSTPLSPQYFQHELAHLAEHALRPADAPLYERWRFDPVRSEGWALLFERVLRLHPRWLVDVGFSREDAKRLATFYREEDEFTEGLIAADLALDTRLRTLSTIDDARRAAIEIAAELEIDWAPEIMLFRQPALLNWRSYVAAWAWRDAMLALLERRFGPEWVEDATAWSAIRASLGTVGSASTALRALESMCERVATTSTALTPTSGET
jgi:hypothetical protein